MPFILGRSGTQYVAMVTRLLHSYCGAQSYCKESNISDPNWLRYLFSSYLIILVPRAHDHSNLRQGSRALAGPDFLSMRRVFVSCFQPIRFDRKSVGHRNNCYFPHTNPYKYENRSSHITVQRSTY